MFGTQTEFNDRYEAGQRLAEVLEHLKEEHPVVLALPRGGVPVAFEVAKALQAEIDLLMVRKLGAPGHPEYGIGALVDGADPQLVLNEEAMQVVNPSPDYVEAEKKRQLAEIERRRETYFAGRQPTPLVGRTVIVVDDGIATGGTVRVALKALRRAKVKRTVLAVPVAPRDTLDSLKADADEVVCLAAPLNFRAVGLHYRNFDQTSDAEVVQLLNAAREWLPDPQ
ncbi:phosphoribosyltransferase [Chelativorans salis]|uniref:Phosphoribosyltransferase n=1 Tax=Chelativorans salis TaxID=2978478 RepID=A0ABT2LR26_9HYPH|nr:phosphoribosyltransferase [Chelativorans sp. EGI FJ00035]MCT7377005.1 phosphoribosyltransferase [Chelativorans sp. EGI FJ00035]